MKKPKAALVIFDLIFLSGSFLLMAGLKPVMVPYISGRYLTGFAITLITWLVASFYAGKYSISRKEQPTFLFRQIIAPNLIVLAALSFLIYLVNATFYSRMMVLGTFGMTTFLEMGFYSLYTYMLVSPEYDAATAFLEKPPTSTDRRKLKQTVNHSHIHVNAGALQTALLDDVGEKATRFIEDHVDLGDPQTLVTATLTRFNILRQPERHFSTIVNIRRVNDVRYLNKFFEAVNHKLPQNGKFIGCAETSEMRRARILRKYPPVLNWILYTLDYILKRIFPKFKPTRKIYFFLTRGNNRVLTRAEILGRLYSCGFEVLEESYSNGLYFFVSERIKEPAFDLNPTYGPFITLRRVGKGGKLIKVYKLRTMYPFAEYLQDYIHKNNNLDSGGKFRDDFRIATSRAILRRFWIDELPMLLNVFKGQIKLVGVRPLSQHYFNLYSKELQEKRTQYRPGLIPPYYADLPKTLEEIQASEMRYLESFERHPLRTQWRYFWKAVWNILFKKARSA